MKAKSKFLHNHPRTEYVLGIFENHVIVDKDDWKVAKDFFDNKLENDMTNIKKFIESNQ